MITLWSNIEMFLNKVMYIDSHCHINFPELSKNIDSVLSNMKEKSITHALCVSVTLDNFESVLKLAR